MSDALQSLNQLAKQVDNLRYENRRLEQAQKILQGRRQVMESSLCGLVVEAVGKYPKMGEEAARYLLEVVNEHKHELIRLAELRLAAEARKLKIKADQTEALIKASIVDIDLSEGGAA